MMNFSEPVHARIDSLSSVYKIHTIDVLRLDLIHPVISGNKWFKLKNFLKEAALQGKNTLLTFGGAFSNHILATAAVAKQHGFKSIGIIRGEKAQEISESLRDAEALGMELHFISRGDYSLKKLPEEVLDKYNAEELFIIAEGGYGKKGAEGAADILELVNKEYTHILAAVGTGTTVAGLASSSNNRQEVMGVSVLKNNLSLQGQINALLPEQKQNQFSILHDYHFGGYAKHPEQLIRFMNDWFRRVGIPSDFVYTGKLFFAMNDLLHKNYFPNDSRLLVIHSGGLQGNRSLPKGTLIF